MHTVSVMFVWYLVRFIVLERELFCAHNLADQCRFMQRSYIISGSMTREMYSYMIRSVVMIFISHHSFRTGKWLVRKE